MHNEKMESEHFPSSIQEGWLRTQFSLLELSFSGDGVVKKYLSTTSPKSMGIRSLQDIRLDCMDLGTPPEPGGEFFDSLIVFQLHKKTS